MASTANRASHRRPRYPTVHPRQRYHVLNPHPALSPVPDPSHPTTVTQLDDDEARYRRLLVRGVLARLLPTDEFENGCVRTLVEEILAEMILGGILVGSMCRTRFWMEAIINAVGDRPKLDDEKGPTPEVKPSLEMAATFWRIAHYAFVFVSVLRWIVVSLFSVPSLPLRGSSSTGRSASSSSEPPSDRARRRRPRPILAMNVWACMATGFGLSTRMPWLEGCFKLIQHGLIYGPGRVGDTNGSLDR